MLVLLGGAPRAGKTTVSRAFAKRTGFAILSLDSLMMALSDAVPSLGIDIAAEPQVIGESMWPLIQAHAKHLLATESDHMVEGDMLQTAYAAEIQAAGGDQVRSCFLGYPKIDPQQKFADIRRTGGQAHDWLRDSSDEYVREVVEFGIRYSQMQQAECERLGLRYFDCSQDFTATTNAAVEYLVR